MTILSREEAECILNPFLGKICQCIEDGWKDLQAIDPEIAKDFEVRTRANIIRDRTVSHVMRRFRNQENIDFRQQEGHLVIGDGNKILLQFKKLNGNLGVSNYQTSRRKLFDAQLPLEGVPKATRLTAGYIPDEFWTKPKELYVVCCCGKSLEWYLRVFPASHVKQRVEFLRLPIVEPSLPAENNNNQAEHRRFRRKTSVIDIQVKQNE